MLDYSAIGARIRACRKKAGLSQEALGKMLCISTTHMSHIETGSTKLSLSVLSELSGALNVSCDELLFGAEPSRDFPDPEIKKVINSCSHEQLKCICDLIRLFSS